MIDERGLRRSPDALAPSQDSVGFFRASREVVTGMWSVNCGPPHRQFLHARARNAEVNSRRSAFCFGPLDLRAQDEVPSALKSDTPEQFTGRRVRTSSVTRECGNDAATGTRKVGPAPRRPAPRGSPGGDGVCCPRPSRAADAAGGAAWLSPRPQPRKPSSPPGGTGQWSGRSGGPRWACGGPGACSGSPK